MNNAFLLVIPNSTEVDYEQNSMDQSHTQNDGSIHGKRIATQNERTTYRNLRQCAGRKLKEIKMHTIKRMAIAVYWGLVIVTIISQFSFFNN